MSVPASVCGKGCEVALFYVGPVIYYLCLAVPVVSEPAVSSIGNLGLCNSRTALNYSQLSFTTLSPCIHPPKKIVPGTETRGSILPLPTMSFIQGLGFHNA